MICESPGGQTYWNSVEDIGQAIAHYGIYDRLTSETIYRLHYMSDVALTLRRIWPM